MVRIDNLEFRYPGSGFVLTVPELHLQAGSRTGFIGPSGSGKTTLLHLIAGIRQPHQGTIRVDEEPISAWEEARRRQFRITRIGLVFQEFALLDYLDVLDNILLPYRITDQLTLTPEARSKARELARQVGIADKLSSRPDELSQGEKQRAAICRAMLPEPSLILADEPTGNLDPDNKQRVMSILREVCTSHNATLITVTHDHGLLDQFDAVIDFDTFHSTGRGAGT